MFIKQFSTHGLQFRFNWKIALAAALAFSLLLKLGFWQLSRAEEKRQAQEIIEARRSALPTPIENSLVENKQALKYLRVSLYGNYINQKSIFIKNKVFQGRFGFEVITPFRLKAINQIVFVSRGWIPSGYGADQLPKIAPVTGEQHIVAEIYVPAGKSFFLAQQVTEKNWPMRLHHFNINGFTDLFEEPLFPYVVRLDKDSEGVLERFWPTIRMNPEMSTSYAFQWFAMSIAVVIGAIIGSTNIVDIIRSK